MKTRVLAAPVLTISLIFGSVVMSAQNRRDSDAVALIGRVLNSNGLSAATPFQDMAATGEVHHYWAGTDVAGTAQLYALGSDKFRFDSTGDEPDILQVDGLRGQIQIGKQQLPISAASLVITKNPILPLLELANALTDQNTTIEYVGPDGTSSNAVTIAVERTHPDLPDFGAFRKLYIINSDSLTITSTIEIVAFSLQDKLSRQYTYGDFITIQGLVVPTTISESLSDQHTWTVHLTNVVINGGVSTDVFKF